MIQNKFPDRFVQHESVNAVTSAVDQVSRCPVHNISRSHLLGPLLKHCLFYGVLDFPDGEYGPDRAINFQVGRTVNGIDEHDVFPRRVFERCNQGFLHFLRDNSAHDIYILERLYEDRVSQLVKLLDILPLNVHCACKTPKAIQRSTFHVVGDDFPDGPQPIHYPRELARRIRVKMLPLHQKTIQGYSTSSFLLHDLCAPAISFISRQVRSPDPLHEIFIHNGRKINYIFKICFMELRLNVHGEKETRLSTNEKRRHRSVQGLQ